MIVFQNMLYLDLLSTTRCSVSDTDGPQGLPGRSGRTSRQRKPADADRRNGNSAARRLAEQQYTS